MATYPITAMALRATSLKNSLHSMSSAISNSISNRALIVSIESVVKASMVNKLASNILLSNSAAIVRLPPSYLTDCTEFSLQLHVFTREQLEALLITVFEAGKEQSK